MKDPAPLPSVRYCSPNELFAGTLVLKNMQPNKSVHSLSCLPWYRGPMVFRSVGGKQEARANECR